MAGIQIGGIVSGMDTNSLVEQLTTQANVSVDRLKGQYAYKQVEDDVYTDTNDKLKGMASDLLSLRLKSTFLTKTVTSTNESVATAIATTDADVGSISVKVSQLAKNSSAESSYTHVALVQAGANVTKITGDATEALEGTHAVTISTSGSTWMSTDKFTIENVGSAKKQAGSTYSNVDANGNLVADVAGTLTFSYTDADGNSQSLTINGTYGTAGQDINAVSTTLEDTLNSALNTSMGTNNIQYVAARADYNSTAGTWNFALYQTTIDNHNIQFAGDDASTLRDELGFSASSSPTVSSTTTINKYHIAASNTDLQNKLASTVSGLVPGADITQSANLTTGTFTFAQDATLKVSSGTYTKVLSGDQSASTLNLTATGLQNAGFSNTASSSLNGTFTINGVTITVADYTKLSVSSLLGMINGSGAGVTASYDSSNDQIVLQSTTMGPDSIQLGSYSDTSSMISFLKLDSNSGATTVMGTNDGSVDATEKLSNAGFSTYPQSGTFTINGISIYVDTSTDTLESLMNKVNKSGAGVTMTYDSSADKIKLVSNGIEPIKVGAASDTSNLLEVFNLVNYGSSSPSETTIGTEGQRAVFQVNGTTYIRESNTVSDVVSGVILTLNSAENQATTINVSVDPSKAVKMFATFIQHYNELMDKLNVPDKTTAETSTENSYTTYLTDTKKKTMSESDIATYEKNYKLYNGYDVIRRSSELRDLKTTLRTSFFQIRSGLSSSINDMSDLGIAVAGAGNLTEEKYGYMVTLSSDYDTIASALESNETFMNALKNNPQDVYKFFANTSDLSTDTAKTAAEKSAITQQIQNETGWARYFEDDVLTRYTDTTDGFIGSKVGSTGTIQKSLTQLETKITDQEDRVQKELERYWAQFSAMEQAIAKAQSQSSSLASITGSSASSSSK